MPGALIASALVPVLVSPLLAGALAVPGSAPRGQDDTLTVGSLDLRPCDVLPGAWCGHLDRPWDPERASTGTVRVGFAFLPASSGDSVGTLVPHEGGPGYSTTGSGEWFAEMYGDLLLDRDMLLVDQRGTGRTAAISCPELDDGTAPYVRAVGRCARSLADRAWLYGTASSADDLAAVLDALAIDRVDMYGDSYGTFFAQVFAGRHPQRLRTLVLDGAYPTYGESAWYPTQGPAVRASLAAVCARSVMCADGAGRPVPLLEDLLDRLRERPVRVRAPGADGRMHRVTLDPASVAAVAYNATYLPATYREFTGAVRAALAGDAKPLGRLWAEFWYTGAGSVNPREYSAGAEAAVSCHDYPQLFDLADPRTEREVQYRDAFRRKERTDPGLYAPFTITEYRTSGWTSFGMCLRWPQPPPGTAYGPIRPAAYPDVPTLVLSGEFDTITTPAEGDMVTARFPDARHVVVANGLHVVGGTGPDGCGARLVRHVVRTGDNEMGPDLAACAADAPPIRAVGDYPREWRDTALPPGAEAGNPALVAVTAVNTAADLLDRWWQSYTDEGLGLRGGTWKVRGERRVRFTLEGVRLAADLPVSGSITWDRATGAVTCELRVPTTAGIRRVDGQWNAESAGAEASVRARGPDASYALRFLAP